MSARRNLRDEPGFALLSVLWIVTALSVVALSVSLLAREQVLTASNRISFMRARFYADDCLERGKSALAAALSPERGESSTPALRLDDFALRLSQLLPPEIAATCTLQFRAAGGGIDLNSADLGTIQRYLLVRGVRSDLASAFIYNLSLRRGITFPAGFGPTASDSLPPAGGQGVLPPIGDLRELQEVSGWQEIQEAAPDLGIDGFRIPLNYASIDVLLSLPGFSREAANRVIELRSRGERISNLQDLASGLPGQAGDSLTANLAMLTRSTTSDPDGWVMTSIAHAGDPQVTVTVEILLRWALNRGSVERRRMWVG